jgi:hypothetical protein
MSTVDDLKVKEKSLLQQLTNTRDSIKSILTKEFQESHDLFIGEKIKFTSYNTNHVGVISGIQYSGYNPNYFTVQLLKKDGNLGLRFVILWNSDLKSVVKC